MEAVTEFVLSKNGGFEKIVGFLFVVIICKNYIVLIKKSLYTLLLRDCNIKKVLFWVDLVSTFVTYILLTSRRG